MMTMLRAERPLRRETAVLLRDGGQPRLLTLLLYPRRVVLRLKGRRYRYEVPWEAVWELGARIEGRRRMEEQRKQREARRKERTGR